jgi:adenosylhomocysteine nucleosidase
MNIAIITAMPQEYRAVQNCLGSGVAMRISSFKTLRIQSAGHEFLLLQSGMGFDNASRATQAIIDYRLTDLFISAGYCGGIGPELRVGDVVVATTLLLAAATGIQQVAVTVPPLAKNFVTEYTADSDRIFAGTFVGTPRVISKKRLAGLLNNDYPCPVVEMESAAIARIASENGIPLLAIRSVSDPAAEELDFSLDEFCDSNLQIRPGRVLLTILRKPRIIPQLIRLSGNSRRASQLLTTALRRLIPLL